MNNNTFTTQQAAEYLSLSPNTLNRWRWSGDGPDFCRFGRAVRYRRADLDDWIAERIHANTAHGAA